MPGGFRKTRPVKPVTVRPVTERHAFWFSHSGYALRNTLRRFFKQKFASLMTLFVIGLSLALPVLVMVLAPDMARMAQQAPQSPGIVAYLDPALNDLQGAKIAASLEDRNTIGSAVYVSKAEALALLSGDPGKDTGGEDSIRTTIAVLGDNPLPGSILITPAAGSESQSVATHRLLANTVRALPQVSQVEINLEWVERLGALTRFARIAGWISIAVLAIACLMAISNTIRLEALRHTRESRVVHLLGASRSFRRRPFVYLGALLGMSGASVACCLASIAIMVLREPVHSLASSYALDYTLPLPTLGMAAIFVMVCTFLGMFAALISVRRIDPRMGA